MNRYLLDTNIVLAYLRGYPLYKKIEDDHKLSSPNAVIMLSVVSKAELMSLGKQNTWGSQRMRKLSALLQRLVVIDINDADEALLEAYSEIDAFSQGKLSDKQLGTSSRNMGKNDLWIAATAYVSKSTLITMDGDFDHLQGSFISVAKYEVL